MISAQNFDIAGETVRIQKEISDEIWQTYNLDSNTLIDEITKEINEFFKRTKKKLIMKELEIISESYDTYCIRS